MTTNPEQENETQACWGNGSSPFGMTARIRVRSSEVWIKTRGPEWSLYCLSLTNMLAAYAMIDACSKSWSLTTFDSPQGCYACALES